MKLFRTEEILWQKVYTKELKQDIKLKPYPVKVTGVVPRVQDVDHRIQKGAVIFSATLTAGVYFLSREGTLRYIEVLQPVRYVFCPEKVLDGMEVRIDCTPETHNYHLAEDTLSVDFLLNFNLEAVIERPAVFAKTLEAKTERIATFRVIKEEKDVAGIRFFFEKPDCRRIITVKPHLAKVETKVFKGLVAVEGEISADVFYVDGSGLERHSQVAVPLERVISCNEAEPEHLARVTAAFSEVHFRPSHKAGNYGIMMVLRLDVKVLKKEESQVVTDFKHEGYQTVKEELQLKEVLDEGAFSFFVAESYPLKGKNLVDLYGRVERVSYEVNGGLLVAQGAIGVEVFYIDENLLSAYRYIEINFSRSHPVGTVQTQVSYELKPRILHLSGVLKDGSIKITSLVEIEYTAVCRRATPVVVDIIPREGIERELFRVEKILEAKTIELIEKNEIILDYPVKLVEDIKGEVENLNVTVLDYRFLIQGGLSVHIYYAGVDGIIRCQKNLFPFGVLGDVKGGRKDMHVRVDARISEVSTEIKTLTRLDTIFLLSFDIEATCQQDLYLVTGPTVLQNRRYRQVYVEERLRRLSYIMPLTAPALFAKDIFPEVTEKWVEVDEAGFWIGGKLRVNAAYVGRDHLVHHDIDELEFKFFIKGKEGLDTSRVSLSARPKKVVLVAGGEMLEGEFEISIKNYYLKTL
ncbi:hypothetical protein AN618_09170 [Fervidicola ferrireducens]|uniref:SipL SPOCS domain-containing protein n=1 Tax=Fervidicola ferrireducens TaxID=520764 RepID=A0A140LAZ4_9FIRM|nr:DUF3794 domain-containing protein [Fervidicola ferrireducens]KXG77719.1 hypothetical protein AN618_09170 [Fervidicola ferrireducens]